MSRPPHKRSEPLARAIENACRVQYIARREARRRAPEGPYLKVPMLDELMPDDAWAGRRVFIIGGGPSLKGFDFSRLRGEIVIAVNKAFLDIDAAIHYTLDGRFIGWLSTGMLGEGVYERWEAQQATPVMLRQDLDRGGGGWYFVDCTMGHGQTAGLSEGLCKVDNSGHGAIHLAAALGSKEIYLLGFDQKGDKNGAQAWYHGGYAPQEAQSAKCYPWMMIPGFEMHAPTFHARGVRIINLNRDSSLRCFEFGDFDALPPLPERPLVVGYCTEGPYEAEAAKMRKSVHRFGLESHIETIPATTWQSATQYKAEFLLKMAHEHPGRTLLCLDADAEMVRFPALAEGFTGDLAVPFVDWAKYGRSSGRELLSGTILFRPTRGVIGLFEAWRHMCRRNPDMWDQRALQMLIGGAMQGDSAADDVKIERLPDAYCQIFDLMSACENPVIKQNQASRRLKT